jgi:hypothetical protein
LRLRDQLLAHLQDDLVLDTAGRFHAVVNLTGAGDSLIPEVEEADWLEALAGYLERCAGAVMRITFSYAQPLDRYSDWLSQQSTARRLTSPRQAEQLLTLGSTMQEAVRLGQARLFADYLVLTYVPAVLGRRADAAPKRARPSAAWLKLQLRHAARAREELHRRCTQLQAALGRADVVPRRVSGDELEALVESAWGTAFAELPAHEREEVLEETVQVRKDWVRTPYGYVRSYLVQEVGDFLLPETMQALARGEGRRLLQFWQQVPLHQAKTVLKFNRTIQATTRQLWARREVADLDALRDEQKTESERGKLSFQGTHLFRYQAILQQWAPTLEELEARSAALELELLTAGQLQVTRAVFQQEHALLSGLPVAWYLADGPERALDASCLARLAWPGPRDTLAKQGVWMGMTLPGRQLTVLDVLALSNPVVELIGTMGSGKSMTQKWLVTQLVYQGYPAYLVNSAHLANGRGEYQDLVEQELGGMVVRLGRGSGVSFNPLQLIVPEAEGGEDPFLEGKSQLLAWLEALLHVPLSRIERVAAGRAYLRAMRQAGIEPEDPATWHLPSPTLRDFCAALRAEPGEASLQGADREAALLLAYLLSEHCTGPSARLFKPTEQLPLSAAQVVCFDLADVPEDLRAACFQQVLSLIRRLTARQARHGGSVVLLDESHLLLQDEQSAHLLETLVRDSRKLRRLILYTVHTTGDSVANKAAEVAHATAGAKLVFRINPEDEATPANLHLSPLETQLVTRLGRPDGECLLLTPTGHSLLQVLVPPPWYSLLTSKPAEVLAQAERRGEASAASAAASVPQPQQTRFARSEPMHSGYQEACATALRPKRFSRGGRALPSATSEAGRLPRLTLPTLVPVRGRLEKGPVP